MTFLSPVTWLQSANILTSLSSAPFLDHAAVADGIAGTGWSAQYHEAPDYQVSLMILPDDDDCLSTFVIGAAGVGLCLHDCRDDTLHSLGEFATLGDAIAKLCLAMADQTGP